MAAAGSCAVAAAGGGGSCPPRARRSPGAGRPAVPLLGHHLVAAPRLRIQLLPLVPQLPTQGGYSSTPPRGRAAFAVQKPLRGTKPLRRPGCWFPQRFSPRSGGNRQGVRAKEFVPVEPSRCQGLSLRSCLPPVVQSLIKTALS